MRAEISMRLRSFSTLPYLILKFFAVTAKPQSGVLPNGPLACMSIVSPVESRGPLTSGNRPQARRDTVIIGNQYDELGRETRNQEPRRFSGKISLSRTANPDADLRCPLPILHSGRLAGRAVDFRGPNQNAHLCGHGFRALRHRPYHPQKLAQGILSLHCLAAV